MGQVPLLPAGVISTEMLGIWWLNVRVVYAWIMLALGFDIGMQALYIKARRKAFTCCGRVACLSRVGCHSEIGLLLQVVWELLMVMGQDGWSLAVKALILSMHALCALSSLCSVLNWQSYRSASLLYLSFHTKPL